MNEKDLVCRKCGSLSLEIRNKGTQIGLYCKDCGTWIKWIPKKDVQAIKAILDRRDEEAEENNILADDDTSFYGQLRTLVLEYEKTETESAEEENHLEQFLGWVQMKVND